MLSLSLPAPERTTASPDDVARQLVRLLPSLYRAIVADLHSAPHAAGMTLAQFRILGRLSERDYRAAELADTLEVGRPTLTATADSLVRRGLVDRLRDLPGDRRGVLLRLTPAGRTVQHALEARSIETVSRLLAHVEDAERLALGDALAALERALRCAERPSPSVAAGGVAAAGDVAAACGAATGRDA